MPFPNEHSARLLSPDTQKIRVRRTKGSGAGRVQGVKIPTSISVIWFILRREGREVPVAQALRFPIRRWSEKEARSWLKTNKIKFILFEPASKKKEDSEMSDSVEIEYEELMAELEGSCQKCEGCVETAETTNTPPWGSIPKTKKNFPNKSQFIIQRGENFSDWKLPYKLKNGKIHCGGVRAASAAAAGARTGKPMSLTSGERRRLNSARRACKITDTTDGISQEMTLTLSTGKAGKFEFLDDRSDDNKRVMRFELMDNKELYNGIRFTKEALQHQLDIFNENGFLVTHGMDHSGKILDQLGKVIEMDMVEEGDFATVFITSEHYKETFAQQEAEKLFDQGLLDYISGGWRASIAYNQDTEEYEVYKPVFREVSSTPIPAKTDAKTIENVCMDIKVGLLLDQAPDMEEIDMTEDDQGQQEPSQPEGKEEQSAKVDTALNERQDKIEQKFAELEAKTEAQERTALLERAAELGLAETEFEGQPNSAIEFALRVANKVKMSTLRAGDPDIPLGGEGQPVEDGSPEMVDFLIKNVYRIDLAE